jgi:hypothetical protein
MANWDKKSSGNESFRIEILDKRVRDGFKSWPLHLIQRWVWVSLPSSDIRGMAYATTKVPSSRHSWLLLLNRFWIMGRAKLVTVNEKSIKMTEKNRSEKPVGMCNTSDFSSDCPSNSSQAWQLCAHMAWWSLLLQILIVRALGLKGNYVCVISLSTIYWGYSMYHKALWLSVSVPRQRCTGRIGLLSYLHCFVCGVIYLCKTFWI